MTNFDYVQKTIDIFEESLASGAPFTSAGALASRIGYSTHHLGHLFHTLCGESLGRYVLRRRLAEASVAIREGELSATEAAERFGWEDYSAFGRAIRKEFGVSPSGLNSLTGTQFSPAIRTRPRLPEPQRETLADPTMILTEPVHATGMVFFMGPNERSFHKPWRIFMHNRALIRGVQGDETWQYSSWVNNASGEDDGLWIHCAVQTDPKEKQDMRFFSRLIPAMHVLRFIHTGPIETIHDTYARIFYEYLPTSAFHLAGNMEAQHYTLDGAVEICLPVIVT